MLDEHVPFPSHGHSFDDIYDMSLEAGNLDDWEHSTSSLSMDFTPSFADPYGHKPVLPETSRTFHLHKPHLRLHGRVFSPILRPWPKAHAPSHTPPLPQTLPSYPMPCCSSTTLAPYFVEKLICRLWQVRFFCACRPTFFSSHFLVLSLPFLESLHPLSNTPTKGRPLPPFALLGFGRLRIGCENKPA